MAGDGQGNNRRELWRAAGALSYLGFTMALSVLVGFGLGYLLDRWLQTLPWCSLAGALLGTVAGFREAYRIIQRFTRNL